MTAQVASATDAVTVAYLNGVGAYGARTKVPTSPPDAFTRVVLTGGGGRRDHVVNDATVAVEAWAKTYAAASTQMLELDAHMLNAPEVSTVIKNVQAFSGPVELPVPDSPYFRVTATYQVTTRTTAL